MDISTLLYLSFMSCLRSFVQHSSYSILFYSVISVLLTLIIIAKLHSLTLDNNLYNVNINIYARGTEFGAKR